MIESATQPKTPSVRYVMRRATSRTVLVAAAAGLVLAGCSDSATGPSDLHTDPYLTLQLNIRSATMSKVAPYNTLQLTATPYTASGAVYADAAAPTYVTKDTTLSVTTDGLVTARSVTASTFVVATLRDSVYNVTHVDTVFITVTDQTPASALATFTIQRPVGDSAKIPVYYSTRFGPDTIKVLGTAADGTNLTSSLPLRFSTSDSVIAKIDSKKGIVMGLMPGQVTLRVTTTYYGVTKTDSLRMTVGNPTLVKVQASLVSSPTVAGEYILRFNPDTIEIGVGGTVLFAQTAILTGPELGMDVVFDDPSAAQPSTLPALTLGMGTGSGNIPTMTPLAVNGAINPLCNPITLCAGSARAFLQAGVYRYHSEQYGSTGTIVVRAP